MIAIVRPLRFGGEEIEYERQWNLPLTWIPMPTYWPGWWSQCQPQPGRITMVAASSVSGITFSMRPRSSRAVHSGLISDR